MSGSARNAIGAGPPAPASPQEQAKHLLSSISQLLRGRFGSIFRMPPQSCGPFRAPPCRLLQGSTGVAPQGMSKAATHLLSDPCSDCGSIPQELTASCAALAQDGACNYHARLDASEFSVTPPREATWTMCLWLARRRLCSCGVFFASFFDCRHFTEVAAYAASAHYVVFVCFSGLRNALVCSSSELCVCAHVRVCACTLACMPVEKHRNLDDAISSIEYWSCPMSESGKVATCWPGEPTISRSGVFRRCEVRSVWIGMHTKPICTKCSGAGTCMEERPDIASRLVAAGSQDPTQVP